MSKYETKIRYVVENHEQNQKLEKWERVNCFEAETDAEAMHLLRDAMYTASLDLIDLYREIEEEHQTCVFNEIKQTHTMEAIIEGYDGDIRLCISFAELVEREFFALGEGWQKRTCNYVDVYSCFLVDTSTGREDEIIDRQTLTDLFIAENERELNLREIFEQTLQEITTYYKYEIQFRNAYGQPIRTISVVPKREVKRFSITL